MKVGIKMGKILIITHDNCDDSEVLYPLYRMLEEGYEVDICALEKREIKAKYFFKFAATLLPEEINPEDYDGLILPGGSAPEKLRQNPNVLKAVRAIFDAEKPVAAICHGPQILISTGSIKNHSCTCYPGIRDDVILAGGCYEDVPVIVDRNLVCSRRPSDLPYFMREFCKLLKKEE